jgi:hypothetical protein
MRFGAAVNLAAALPVGFSLKSCRRLHSLTTANHPWRLARGRLRGMNDNGSDEVAHGGLFLEERMRILKNGRRDRHGLTCSFVQNIWTAPNFIEEPPALMRTEMPVEIASVGSHIWIHLNSDLKHSKLECDAWRASWFVSVFFLISTTPQKKD